MMRFGVFSGVAVISVLLAGGCTRESLRVALTAQQRADQVQQAVFDRQHESLCVLLYRDLKSRLERAGQTLTAEQRSALNEVWNERDLIEYWLTQHERAKALRMVGVDTKLYAEQSPLELLYKRLKMKAGRAESGLDSVREALPELLTREQ